MDLRDINGVNKLKEIYEDDEKVYIILEYCKLGTLREQLGLQNGLLLEQNVIEQIAFQILQAVNEIHSKDFIHRDIKLDNILVKRWSTFSDQTPLV